MRRALLFAALMSVSFPALAITANMPGDPCPSQFGVTKLSDDKANIIACLQTSGTNATLVWKATTQGGGGITGGCEVYYSYNSRVAGSWGKGCQPTGSLFAVAVVPSPPILEMKLCNAASTSGYVCGASSLYGGGSGGGEVFCQCANNN